MSLQVTTGSLLALGVGAGDIATLYTLARRTGNWLSAASGDQDLLTLLDEDEMNLLRRRGTIDLIRFKRRWGESLRLLENGRPQKYESPYAKKLLSEMTRFTASMICIVAALDEFASSTLVREICKRLLVKILSCNENGEDLLASQLRTRMNSWRSAAAVRDLSIECRRVRNDLVLRGYVISGLLPPDEVNDMVDFLYWLLARSTEVYTSPSSDVTGFALCLAHLSFEVLSVEGLGSVRRETPCQFIYDPKLVLHEKATRVGHNFKRFRNRELSTTVSLNTPEECFGAFPIDYETANCCRVAWQTGARAAQHIRIQLSDECLRADVPAQYDTDIRFDFVDTGSKVQRVDPNIHILASMGLARNHELCEALHRIFGQMSGEILRWVIDQTYLQFDATQEINSPDVKDEERINCFTIFQAFFMGYYYTAFLSIVDTSTLQIQTVLGSWGYRSADFFIRMRSLLSINSRRADAFINDVDARGASRLTVTRITREKILDILSMLFCNRNKVNIPTSERVQFVLGIVGKRTILINSLLNPCSSPTDIGRFVLLDVDVGGIPTSVDGTVRAGHGHYSFERFEAPISPTISRRGPEEDCTKHIEPDWDGDPETTVLCIRYRGRRIGTLNPAITDSLFCRAYIPPSLKPRVETFGPGIQCDIQDILRHEVPLPSQGMRVFIQADKSPSMRYAAVGFLCYKMGLDVALISNCVHDVIEGDREGLLKILIT